MACRVSGPAAGAVWDRRGGGPGHHGLLVRVRPEELFRAAPKADNAAVGAVRCRSRLSSRPGQFPTRAPPQIRTRRFPPIRLFRQECLRKLVATAERGLEPWVADGSASSPRTWSN
jgi:hypothetical protein